ncbi:MAG: sensor domain-containing diguanylate cyclase [Azonexus sp.]
MTQHDPDYYAVMWADLLSAGYWDGELWSRRKNGELFAELVAISAVRDNKGNTRQYVALFSDITVAKEHQSWLEHVAHFDALTNLPNRSLLTDRLQQAMAQALRRQKPLAVAFVDLDGFKAINDQHGHDAGDQVLVALAKRMKDELREGDTLARIGGDEFVAVLIDLDDTAACLSLLKRMLTAVEQPVMWGDLGLQVSASIGVTFYPQADEVDAKQLIRQADQSMYRAKIGGKNRYHIFDSAYEAHPQGYREYQV